jgi:CDP-glycerol glycerophosphotransferase (TagB/SpsB family)
MRKILVDARTPVNYTMFAPVHAAIEVRSLTYEVHSTTSNFVGRTSNSSASEGVRVYFTASEEPSRLREILNDAGPLAPLIHPARAALMRFDAYVTSDFMWTPLLHKTCRIQMFHGVGGKYGFDAPTESLREWHRLFFVNRRRLNNCVAAGAIDADSPAVRLIGMPKVDCLVDGSLRRDAVLIALGLSPERPTVLYAPTWSPASSLNAMGIELIERLLPLPINVIVKLHDRSRDPRARYSGGIDWAAKLRPYLSNGSTHLAASADICPYLAAADVMVTDHSSAGFEYLLLDRPVVRIHMPELITQANIHRDYVQLLADVSESTHAVDDTIAAVERALADPHARSSARRAVAADLFHEPGTATRRCVAALYEAIGLESATTATTPVATTATTPVASAFRRITDGERDDEVRLKPDATDVSWRPSA